MASPGVARLSTPRAIDRIGLLIDESQGPRRGRGLAKALAWTDEIEARDLNPGERCELDYFRSNAWHGRLPRGRRNAGESAWENDALHQVIFYLRRARNAEGFGRLHSRLRCQILTNLGNSLSNIGRVIDATEQWRAALAIEPRFWMARGNLGRGLLRYAQFLYDPEQAAVLFLEAHRSLRQGIEDATKLRHFGYPEALASFEAAAAWIERRVDIAAVAATFVPDGLPLGRSQAERSYRVWCLHNRLFLDPFNDAMTGSAAAVDILMLPSFVAPLLEPPVLIGFFNQLKQEFVAARWEHYSATRGDRPHFSDREVMLANTLDYPAYGLSVEKLRTSFRIAYSLLDKIAFFVNEYFKLQIAPSAVSFRTVWKEGKPKNPRLRQQFARSKNQPLRALFWLSKDIFDGSIGDVLEPDARSLHELRVRLEHRYVKVHEFGPLPPTAGKTRDLFHDTLAYSVGRYEFEQKALRVLKLIRAALIYLSLAMHQEEHRRRRARRSKKITVGQSLPSMDHKWKR
jgi:hypothetical protein